MDVLLDLIDPKWWLTMFGAFATIGVLAIVFAETGLLFGFFLPGDSLLVSAGIFAVPAAAAGLGISPLSLPVLLVAAPLCAIAGAQLGHFLGAKFGRTLFDRPDSRLFKQEHVQKAEYYFEKFGPAKAVVLARFMPIVRTFLNPVAGVLGMDSRRFLLWNIVGGIAWIESMLLFGYFVGSAVEDIDKYILPGVAVIVLVSIMPIVIEVIKNRRSGGVEPLGGKHHRAAGVPAPAAATAGPAPDAVDPFDLYINQMGSGGSFHTGQPGGSFPGAARPADPFSGAAPSGDPFPGAAQPGNPYPEAGRPGDPYSGAAQPGNPYPGSGRPGGSYPEAGHPGASHPATAYPGESYPGGTDLGGRSGEGYSGSAYPGYSQPGDSYPGAAQPAPVSYPGSEPVPQQPAASPDWQAWQAWQGPDRNR